LNLDTWSKRRGFHARDARDALISPKRIRVGVGVGVGVGMVEALRRV